MFLAYVKLRTVLTSRVVVPATIIDELRVNFVGNGVWETVAVRFHWNADSRWRSNKNHTVASGATRCPSSSPKGNDAQPAETEYFHGVFPTGRCSENYIPMQAHGTRGMQYTFVFVRIRAAECIAAIVHREQRRRELESLPTSISGCRFANRQMETEFRPFLLKNQFLKSNRIGFRRKEQCLQHGFPSLFVASTSRRTLHLYSRIHDSWLNSAKRLYLLRLTISRVHRRFLFTWLLSKLLILLTETWSSIS